jgi:hypothetical protein
MLAFRYALPRSDDTRLVHLHAKALLAPLPRIAEPSVRLAIILLSAPENRARREHVRASWLNPVQDRTRGGAARRGVRDAVPTIAVRGCFVMPSYAREIATLRAEADAHGDMAFVDISTYTQRVYAERDAHALPDGADDGQRGALLLEGLRWAARAGRSADEMYWRERLRSRVDDSVGALQGWTHCLRGFAWTHVLKATDASFFNRFYLAAKLAHWPQARLIVASYSSHRLVGATVPEWWIQEREAALRADEARWRVPFTRGTASGSSTSGEANSTEWRGVLAVPKRSRARAAPPRRIQLARDPADGSLVRVESATRDVDDDASYWLAIGENERPPLELSPRIATEALAVPRGGAWFASRDVIAALLAVDDRLGLTTTLAGAPLKVGVLVGVTAAASRGRKANRAAKKMRARLLRNARPEDICFARWTARYGLLRTHAPSIVSVRKSMRDGGGAGRASEATGLPLRYDRFPDVCRLDEWLLQLGGGSAHGGIHAGHAHGGHTHGGPGGAPLGGIDVWSVRAALRRCALPTPTGAWSVGADHEFVLDEGLADALADGLFAGRTVADLGAGFGLYCARWEQGDAVAAALCYDGAEGISELTGGRVTQAELTTHDLDLGVAFDWTLALGVGEYIPPRFTRTFVANVARNAARGVVLAWGVPGQTGAGRLNTLPNEAVRRLMREEGFRHDARSEAALRRAAHFPWFKQALQVFVRV